MIEFRWIYVWVVLTIITYVLNDIGMGLVLTGATMAMFAQELHIEDLKKQISRLRGEKNE